ncbi:MAG: FAD:protein FMN transferase [candidate division Zixibacteria bacterium]|nr:FAD:protein FMN transferase [candidate division Zixibacteria bacterium]
MASPCEILIRCRRRSEAEHVASLAAAETRRIERKLSRYRDDNIIHAINAGTGAAVEVDDELARLLTYADQCYRLSGGLFDITSGVLRRAWKFDGSTASPDRDLIESLLGRVGWEKVEWDGRRLRLQPGMEIDLGGLGKEYAADRAADLAFRASGAPLMANFGGDIRALSADPDSPPWVVGIEDPLREGTAVGRIDLSNGGVATSGDARRFCLVEGVRLGHILNPRTGWPVADAPRSVTVLGDYCVEAGFLATLAMLHGRAAEDFLAGEKVPYHCIR